MKKILHSHIDAYRRGSCLRFLVFFLLLNSGFYSAFAQVRKISGAVTGAKGEPLTGVTVKVKNGPAGTVTDVQGRFTINVPNPQATLVFSYIGFVTQEQAIGNREQITVALVEQKSDLNEVVVIGYGTARKKDLTGSVGQVPVTDMTKAPVRSIDESLAGRVAGVQINSSDGQPGSQANIVIRGPNSITQDNSPLYVVDGFPIEGFNLNTFNPQDIQSIEVLKDASSTAIYGARGANGVVIINTKKGVTGTPKINFTTTQSYNANIKRMKLMNAYDFLSYNLERDGTLGNALNPTPTYIYLTQPNRTLADYRNYESTDWQSPFFKTGRLSNYSLALRGGTAQTLYSVSGSIDDQTGTIIATGYQRYQGRVTLDQTVNSKLKVGINANYARLKQYGNAASTSTNSGTTNILYSVWGYSPLSTFTEDDSLDPTTNTSNDYKFNPVLNQMNLVRDVYTNNLNVNTYLTYNITPELVFKATGVINNTVTENENFNNTRTYYGSPTSNAGLTNGVNGSVMTTKVNNWANENTLTYNKTFAQSHNLNVLVGFTQQGNTSSVRGFGANFLPNESLGVSGLDEGTLAPASTRASSSLWNAASFLGRVAYNYKSKYYFTGSYRADGSSKFSSNNHWSYFPSGALAWRFTEEGFFKNKNILTDGKIRASYGRTGNNRVGDFSYLARYAVQPGSSYVFNNAYVPIIVPLTIANPDLKWETTDQYDAGLDLAFLKSRVNLTVDIYRKKTSNLLLNATLPASSGYGSAIENIGSVQNQGLEITLNTVNISNQNFQWSSSFNISFNQNKILSLANNQQTLLTGISWDNNWSGIPAYIAKIGQPLGLMYGYVWDGNYQYSDFTKTSTDTYLLRDNVPSNGNARSSIQPGDIKYKDINGDGVVNTADYTIIGHSLPVHIGGFNNNFVYKNFDLNVFFQWSYGNQLQNTSRMVFEGNALNKTFLEQFDSYTDHWMPNNTASANYRVNGFFGGGYSTRTIEDGSYLRLKTVQFGYNLPKKWLDKVKITSLRIYVSGQNLYTWTKYTGLDPEVSTYNSALTGGFDYSAYPRPRTLAFGANVTF
ncbi:TonB-dependent receptor [Mucilaginibacter sp. PAMB04168]|uniref:SusC/RagA family TonB-linked outer membrane protein n=1 Tax=Mucilaginibacter sp. PAMB04168 TaxID=3138567 RepID=UPI0031F70186